MSLTAKIGFEVIKAIANKAIDKTIDHVLKDNKTELKAILKNLPELFETHLIELINWSAETPFMDLHAHQNIELTTVELSISPAIQRYEKMWSTEEISENDLLKLNKNILLLGHPGAGKTTTVKRLILNYFLDGYQNVEYDFPILLKFRKFKVGSTVSTSLLDLFGIPYQSRIVKVESSDNRGNITMSERSIIHVGDVPIDIFVAKFLNETKAILILDGLDEAPQENQDNILEEVESLGLKLLTGKIILTVRKSKLSSTGLGFTKFEITPLDEKRIKSIAKSWLGSSKGFYDALKNKPYRDLASRPIFLTLLLILYKLNNKNLPYQSYEVYRDATYLILKDWDEHRRIQRKSAYAEFNARKKLKFLYELSFNLTYRVKKTIFSTAILREVYQNIYSSYNLPKDEIDDVISEIQSHNGIISISGYDSCEFSHLSIQEYLCAEHIITLPFSASIIAYFYQYPEPLAIAITLSGDPGSWFANLLLNKNLNIGDMDRQENGVNYDNSIFTLLSRLVIETPIFKCSEELGMAMLYLLFISYTSINLIDIIDQLLRFPNVFISLNMASKKFSLWRDDKEYMYFKRTAVFTGSYFLEIPLEGKISKQSLSMGSINFSVINDIFKFEYIRERA
ncbi:NACHT domain-containing protein [Mucilaginibacter ginsenosidivorax]|uniref:NACHT domain-containing protein n=1 Tax=Mucilaginibacter ginsenosidivorax TaxID=862126 RepID=A0A5B8VZE3_9SPHI|nr:NACHT domain-containing protein [Mucilaginibacter ginsenosidivorax]QEC75906.1 NACHT domain-containing protein [Mucilaginibacter ginsenosidivorax]